MKNKDTVICLSTQRSGTIFMKSWFDQNPEYVSFGEIFNKRHNSVEILGKYGIRSLHSSNQSISINQLYDLETKISKEHKKVFFKLFYEHLYNLSLEQQKTILENRKIIHLIRKNPLASYFSKVKAEKEGIYKAETFDKINKAQYGLDRIKFDKWFMHRSKQIKFYSEFIKNFDVEIIYYQSANFEHYLNEKLNNILNTDFKFKSTLLKQNPFPLNEVIKNYEIFQDVDDDNF